MKAYISLIVLVVCSIILVPSLEAATISAATSIGNATFTPSSGVSIGVKSDTAKFTATSVNNRGDKEYCTCGGLGVSNCDPAKMYSKTVNVGSTATEPQDANSGCSGYTPF